MKPAPKWSSKVYDYEKRKPVDYDAVDVDLQFGWWIRCRCCGRKQRMYHAFDADAWNSHKLTPSHQQAMMPIEVSDSDESDESVVQQVLSQTTKIRAPKSIAKRKYKAKQTINRQGNRQRPAEYADFAAAMVQAIENDTDYLVFYRSELDRRVKEDRCTKDLIRGMSLLIVEQQEDVEELRDQIESLTRTVQDLQERMQRMRTDMAQPMASPGHKQKELHNTKSLQHDPPLEVAVDTAYNLMQSSDLNTKLDMETNVFVIGNDDDDNDEAMNMFDNQIHLMCLD